MPDGDARAWALQVYGRSVLKQQKYKALRTMVGTVDAKRCLDIGGDNGVISLLLRELGGEWHSSDLDERTVAAIRSLVGEHVAQIANGRLPYPDAHFDLVVIVDMLEHLQDDRAFVVECARVLRPGGTLVVNVPHPKPRSLLTRLRYALGLTDEKHGHVRPGYAKDELEAVLGPNFAVQKVETYCRSCSEFIDIVLNAAYEWRRGPVAPEERSDKGTVVTQSDWSQHSGSMRMLGFLYPLLRAFAAGDVLLRWQSGYRLIVRATLVRGPVPAAIAPSVGATGGTE